MKVSELTGALLDYWVAKACGYAPIKNETGHWYVGLDSAKVYSPSTNWAQGGPIIERERISIAAIGKTELEWFAEIGGAALDTGVEVGYGEFSETGPTPLIAAMRAYVASKYGDEVPDDPA